MAKLINIFNRLTSDSGGIWCSFAELVWWWLTDGENLAWFPDGQHADWITEE